MNEKYMNLAIKEAEKAGKLGEVPVGAVIVKDNVIIAKAHNKKELMNVPIYHAEILAIIKACKKLKTWRLNKCLLYVNLEPCEMCYAAIKQARIEKVIYGVHDNDIKIGNVCKKEKISDIEINKKCEKILKDFFRSRRK